MANGGLCATLLVSSCTIAHKFALSSPERTRKRVGLHLFFCAGHSSSDPSARTPPPKKDITATRVTTSLVPAHGWHQGGTNRNASSSTTTTSKKAAAPPRPTPTLGRTTPARRRQTTLAGAAAGTRRLTPTPGVKQRHQRECLDNAATRHPLPSAPPTSTTRRCNNHRRGTSSTLLIAGVASEHVTPVGEPTQRRAAER